LSWAPRARAQDATAAAQIEFDKGHKLMVEGKAAEACAAFEKSQQLDPQVGTRYNLGRCYEQLGKLASAWNAYREVAQRDTNAGRKRDAARRAGLLKSRLTKLLVNAASSPDGFAVKLNGEDATNLLGIEAPVDPGQYTVVASAPGYKDWSATVTATGEGLTVTVAIPALEKAAVATGPTTTGEPPVPEHAEPGKSGSMPAAAKVEVHAARPGHRRKVLGIAIGAGGAALTIGGVVAGVMARGKWNDAKAVCGGSLSCPSDADTARANQLGDAARTRANVATALIGVGVVAVGVGTALWLTAPRESRGGGVAIVPAAGPDGFSVTMEGRF